MHDLDRAFADFGPPPAEPPPPPAFSRPWIVAGLAVLVGVVIDTVALHQPPGLGLMLGLWIGLLVAASAGSLLGEPRPAGVIPVLGAGLVVATFVGIRTSPVLLSLNVAATIGIMAVLIQLHRAGGIDQWTITRYWRHPFASAAEMAAGAGAFVANDLRRGFRDEHRQRLRSVAIGVLIGAPLLAVFAGLFASADSVFSDYLDRLIQATFFGSIFWRLVFSLLAALAVAGLWRTVRAPRPTSRVVPRSPRIDSTTGITVLALLVLLFLFFVTTQVIGYRPELVRISDFSENARRGFFQLVIVAALVLNVLLLFDWLTGGDDRRRSPAFDRLAIALIALTGIVMVSAMNRMRLYVNTFGFTELRFYTSVFMVWLAFVLVWFIRTVLRNRHASFALGLVVSGLMFIVGLSAANPDSLIVKLNWDRHLHGAGFSDRYNSELSVDSVVALIDIRESEPAGRWCFIEQRLFDTREQLTQYWDDHGLLGDSWAAWRARNALDDLDLSAAAGLECVDPRTGGARSGRGD